MTSTSVAVWINNGEDTAMANEITEGKYAGTFAVSIIDSEQNSVAWDGELQEAIRWLKRWRESATSDWWILRERTETVDITIWVKAYVFEDVRFQLIEAMKRKELREWQEIHESRVAEVMASWEKIEQDLTDNKE